MTRSKTSLRLPAILLAVGLAGSLLVHDPRLALPPMVRLLPGFLALVAALITTTTVLLTSNRAGPKVAWVSLTLAALAASGPTMPLRASFSLMHPGTLVLGRTLGHSLLLVLLLGLATATSLRNFDSAPRSVTLLDGALLAAVTVQIALGVALRFHPVLLWPHVLVALTAVMPLAIRSGLRSLLEPEDGPGLHLLPVLLLVVLVLQIAFGVLAFVVPAHLELGRRAASIDVLVTSAHFVIGGLLLVTSIAQAIHGPRPR